MAMTNELDMIIETLRGVDDEMADGIMRARAAQNGPARVGEASDFEKSVQKLLNYLRQNVASSAFHEVRRSTRSDFPLIERFSAFRRLVTNGGSWDIKKQFAEWSWDPETETQYFRDIWGNIHYGYLGKAAGFFEVELTQGAGKNQLDVHGSRFDGIIDNALAFLPRPDGFGYAPFDDPADQRAIKLGFDLWARHGHSVSEQDIKSLVRNAKDQLNTKKI
jgi:hypothetical protein